MGKNVIHLSKLKSAPKKSIASWGQVLINKTTLNPTAFALLNYLS